MTEPVIGFNREGAEQYKKIAREVTRRMMNETPHRARWQQRQGSTGAKIISFQIVSSTPGDRRAQVEILQRSFSGPVFGSELEDSTVVVYDTDGCHLNEPNIDLTGRRGKAVLMLVDAEAAALHFPDEYDPPEYYWNVLTLCCPSIICDN